MRNQILALALLLPVAATAQQKEKSTVLHAAHLLDVAAGKLISPGEVLVTGNEAFQTVLESVPQRTLLAASAAKADLLAGFTAERDMGTEGAGCADVAVRNAINSGLIPGPRMRMSCNAIDINGGHEDNSGLNPAEHLLSNADRADDATEV